MDSNILVYAGEKTESAKTIIAKKLLVQGMHLSPQVIFETLNVFLKKLKMPLEIALLALREYVISSVIVEENLLVIRKALILYQSGAFQPYDAKIVATALAAGCTIRYSEDMQHGLVIDEKLTIVNPFL